MADLTRRTALQYSLAALATVPFAPPARAETANVNPFAAKTAVFTVVTDDMAASLHFYRDVLGYGLIRSGKLDRHLPTIPGAGEVGRRYALLNVTEQAPAAHGAIRLLEAPRGAAANRPRGQASAIDGGLLGYQCMTRSWDESYRHLTEAGVKTISPPMFYSFRGITPLPDAPVPKHHAGKTLSLYVPGGGEQLCITCSVDPVTLEPLKTLPNPGLYGAINAHIVTTRNRWPLFDFYETAFGFKATSDIYSGEEAVNLLDDVQAGTQYQFGFLAKDVMEWWEMRQFRPAAAPFWPTALDKTGLAMTTLLVSDLDGVRARIRNSAYPILGEGLLPMPSEAQRNGFYVRGAEGELYEVAAHA